MDSRSEDITYAKRIHVFNILGFLEYLSRSELILCKDIMFMAKPIVSVPSLLTLATTCPFGLVRFYKSNEPDNIITVEFQLNGHVRHKDMSVSPKYPLASKFGKIVPGICEMHLTVTLYTWSSSVRWIAHLATTQPISRDKSPHLSQVIVDSIELVTDLGDDMDDLLMLYPFESFFPGLARTLK